MSTPRILSLFGSHWIEGDDALPRLAQRRLREMDSGAELYPGSPEHLLELLTTAPTGVENTAHLPRGLNLLDDEAVSLVLDYARTGSGIVYAINVHDNIEFEEKPAQAIDQIKRLDAELGAIQDSPMVFLEYASGLSPDFFATLFEETRDCHRVSCCIDVGHVGIWICQTTYTDLGGDINICDLHPNRDDLAERMPMVRQAVAEALPSVIYLTKRLARLGKPLHFHLHDGHPVSNLSPYGVSDHLSFLQTIRVPFALETGGHLLRGMYGVGGLVEIVQAARELPAEKLSFLLEVHPQEGRSPLGPHEDLFDHWLDRTNGERMNYYLDMLQDNVTLLRAACGIRS